MRAESNSKDTPSTSRVLTGMERALTLTSDYAPFNVVCAVHLRHGPDPERVRESLRVLQHRHPLLNARIMRRGRHLVFEREEAEAIQLRVGDSGNAGWQREVEDELAVQLDRTRAPMIRCSYLRSQAGDADVLVLSAHHAVVDGQSLANLVHELLTGCDRADAVDAGVLLPQPPTRQLLPAGWRGPRLVGRIAAFMVRQMVDEVIYRRWSRGQARPAIPPPSRNRILPLRLSAGMTESLVRWCRNRRIPLNAVLCAAMLTAVRGELYGERATALRYMTFCDLRPYLRPPVPSHHLGAHLAMLRFTARFNDGRDVAGLAGAIAAEIYRATRRGDKFAANVMSPAMMQMVLRNRVDRMTSTALSYTGPLSLERRYGSIEVMGFNAFVPSIDVGPQLAAQARLFRDELWLDLLYLESELDRATAEATAGRLIAALKGLAQETPKGTSHASSH